MTDPAPDTLSLEDLAQQAQEAIDFLNELVSSDSQVFSSEDGDGEDDVVDEAAQEVEQASGGAVSAQDYAANNTSPSTSPPGATIFERVLNEAKLDLMNLAKNNLNAFTRQAIKQALELVTDIETILGSLEAEVLKIQIAHAAGLITPPDRREVKSLRDDAQLVRDETNNAVIELQSARNRREAARKALVRDKGTGDEPDLKPVNDRFVQPQSGIPKQNRQDPLPVNLSLAASSANDPSLETDIDRRGRAPGSLTAATAALQGSVLDKISYIAICAVISSIGTSSERVRDAIEKFERLKEIVDKIMESLGGGFLNTLKDQLQEGIIEQLSNIGDDLQDKLEAFDTFLASLLPQLPTFVRTVDAIGDIPDDLPVLESIAAQCGLTIQSFCDMQGLLEVAKSLDAELGLVLPRLPALARVRMVVQAPEADDIRPPAVLPDLEANMILVGALEGNTRVNYVGPNATHVIARFPRANIRSELSAPVPPAPGSVAQDAALGDTELVITPDPGNIYNFATLGNITINPGPLQQVVRYSEFVAEGADFRFTLIDALTSLVTTGAPVQVTGEQRNTFEGAFQPNRAIKGGPGRLALAGDGERRQQLNYLGSDFDPSTGEYTFELDTVATPLASPAPPHKFQLLCRPHQTKKVILYKDTSLASILTTGKRFTVINSRIYALEDKSPFNIDATFDWSANGTHVIDDINDYALFGAGSKYRVLIGTDNTPYALEEFGTDGLGNYVVLETTYGLGDQERVTLSRVDKYQEPGSSTIRLKLDRRQQEDIQVRNLAEGATANIAGRVIIDGGDATVMVGSITETTTGIVIVGAGNFRQILTSRAPIIRGDEQVMPDGGARIEVQHGQSTFTTRITGTDAVNKKAEYRLPQRSGSVDSGVTTNTRTGFYATGQVRILNGTGTKFLSEFKIGDHLYVTGPGASTIHKVVEIRSDLEMVVNPEFDGSFTGQQIYACAAGGAPNLRFSIQRQPREDKDFTAITRVPDTIPDTNGPTSNIFDLTLATPTQFAHELQEPEVPTTVKIIPQDQFDAFRASFSVPAVSVTPRFDGSIVPPGTTTIRAVFEDPDQEGIFGPLVLQAQRFFTESGFEIPIGPASTVIDPETGDYVFDITNNPLIFPLTDGDIIEVETLKSVFDFLEELFGSDDWNNPFDDFVAGVVEQLKLLESKICRLLGGRPMDVGVTALAIIAASAAARLTILFPLRLTLSSLLISLPESPIIEAKIERFAASGMDAAVRVLENGDVVGVAQLQPTNATSEGRAIQALDAFREVVETPSKIKLLENAKSLLRGLELDKEILASARRPYKEIASDKLSRQETAATNLSLDVETATS